MSLPCARDRLMAALEVMLPDEIEGVDPNWNYEAMAVDLLAVLRIDPSVDLTPHYMIRRTDDESMFGEFTWANADGPEDWDSAVLDSDGAGESAEYELVTYVHTRSVVQSFGAEPTCPECGEGLDENGNCKDPTCPGVDDRPPVAPETIPAAWLTAEAEAARMEQKLAPLNLEDDDGCPND